jgi:hypothetical protein
MTFISGLGEVIHSDRQMAPKGVGIPEGEGERREGVGTVSAAQAGTRRFQLRPDDRSRSPKSW